MANLTIRRGDDREITVTLRGSDTFASGDTVRFTARSAPGVTASISKTSGGSGVTFTPGNNTATAAIDAADTASLDAPTQLMFDWQLVTAAGKTRTLETGILIIERDYT